MSYKQKSGVGAWGNSLNWGSLSSPQACSCLEGARRPLGPSCDLGPEDGGRAPGTKERSHRRGLQQLPRQPRTRSPATPGFVVQERIK